MKVSQAKFLRLAAEHGSHQTGQRIDFGKGKAYAIYVIDKYPKISIAVPVAQAQEFSGQLEQAQK